MWNFLAGLLPRPLVRAAAVRLMTYNGGDGERRSCINALNAWDGIKRRKRSKVAAIEPEGREE